MNKKFAKKFELFKTKVFKVYQTVDVKKNDGTPSRANRIDISVIWWLGQEYPWLEKRRYQYIKKYESWFPRKQVGWTADDIKLIVQNQIEIIFLTSQKLNKETGEPA